MQLGEQVLLRGLDNVIDRQTLIKKRDAISPTPEQRAQELWSAIHTLNPRPTQWDIVCFCVESLAVVSSEYEFLKPIVARLVSVVYTAHYNTPEPWPSALDDKRNEQRATSELGDGADVGSGGNRQSS